jgi:ribosomal protein S18 acetylase RimI-like enzyme
MTVPPGDAHYRLGGGLTLEPLPQDAARGLAQAFAGIEPWRRYPYDAINLERYLAGVEAGAPRLALMREQEIAGAIGLRTNWLRGPYLQFFGILPAHQGAGLGSCVLNWLANEAEARGARNVWVCVSDFNAGARRLYERHGFEVVGPLPDLVKPGTIELLMRRQILQP